MVSKNETIIRMLDKTTNTLFFLMHAKRKHTGSVYKTEEIIRLSEKPSSDKTSLNISGIKHTNSNSAIVSQLFPLKNKYLPVGGINLVHT